MKHEHYLAFAVSIRTIIDSLVELIDKRYYGFDSELRPLKDELVKALELLTATEAKALKEGKRGMK